MLSLGGCSSGTSRFDFPAFSLTGRNTETAQTTQTAYADPASTGSLPVPPEPVYGNGGSGDTQYANTRYSSGSSYQSGASNSYPNSTPVNYGSGSYGTRRDLPPPANYSEGGSYNTRPTPVSYTAGGNYTAASNPYSAKQAVYMPPSPPGWHASPVVEGKGGVGAASGGPAPIRTAMADRAQLAGPGSQTITVKPGDSLYVYATRYHVSVAALKEANGMTDMRLTAGQKLVIPASGSTVHDDSYIVQSGDSLNSIAYSHNVEPKVLADLNHISDARSLQIGQELKLPGGHAVPPQVAETEQHREPAPVGPAESAESKVHVVKTQKIESPDASSQQASNEQQAPAADATPQSQASNSDNGASGADDESHLASNTTLPSPDPMSGQRFRWPVQGRVISKFGTRADGGHNDGIDLAVPQGTEVRAAENGVVAYAGDELKGYGNLVLIRHANNWVTAYAHNENLLVKRGDKVSRGQVIAKAGATGSVSQPELHFELRKGSRPVDPIEYMTSNTASAD